MPNPALNAYLARNYLDGAKAEAYLSRDGNDGGEKRRKKRKKREVGEAASGSGFRLIDDNDESWKRKDDDSGGEDAVLVQGADNGASSSRARWSRMGREGREDGAEVDGPQIIGQDVGENADMASPHSPSNVAAAHEPHSSSSNGIRAGLKTREQMRAERLERERRQALEGEQGGPASEAEEQRKRRLEHERQLAQQETVYRDASGRRVDVAKEQEEERRREQDRQRLEREKQDWNKGEVQRRQARELARREHEERSSSFARHADDERMNAALRNVDRADDPAARFLTRKASSDAPRKPTYKGSFPPNRFGIRPGYRWDGVERSNGFEAKLFQRRNERSRRKTEMQAWGQEDM